MIVVKNEADLRRMRESGRLASCVRESVRRMVGPGASTEELSIYAGQLIRGFGAKSAFFGYRGYPGQICVSVNEAVVHGVPGDRRIELGDIVSIDIGVDYEGYVGDTATTVMVGVTDPEIVRLVRTAEKALEAGIRMAVEGRKVSDISHAIEQVAASASFSVVRDFVGHGIGRKMHEDPQIPNFGAPGRGARLKAGMTLAIEPMINQGGFEVDVQKDGWTVLTRDRKPSAHVEHTVAVGVGQAEILTI